MKLSKCKLTETFRKLADGKTVYQARKTAGISERRGNQILQKYRTIGILPVVGLASGRPRKEIIKKEKKEK